MASEPQKICANDRFNIRKSNNSDRTMSFLEELSSLSPTILPWDRFSQWIHAICIVTFDLEVGQAMEVKLKICFSFKNLKTQNFDKIT